MLLKTLDERGFVSYIHLRYQLYLHQIRQLVSAFKQLIIFFYLFMYLALPIFAFMGFLSLGVIARNESGVPERIIYQTLFLICSFAMVRIQTPAILAKHYLLFLQMYAVTRLKRAMATLLVTVIASNFFLIAPLYLAFQIPNSAVLMTSLHFPLFVLLNTILIALSLRLQFKPIVSLALFPLSMLIFDRFAPSSVSPAQLNALWVVFLTVDLAVLSLKKWQAITLPIKHHALLIFAVMLQNKPGMFARVFLVVLISALYAYMQQKLSYPIPNTVQLGFVSLFGLIIATQQFDIEAFNRHCQFYLSMYPQSAALRVINEYIVSTISALVVGCIALTIATMTTYWLAAIILANLVSVYSIKRFKRNFFILPAVIFAALSLFTM